ncbi:MAG: hypothetical protein ABL898_18640 [Hyphomicrobiaceae bacterium]|nr:hypothetical protein [Hyphomicrobiaceae bacterium]
MTRYMPTAPQRFIASPLSDDSSVRVLDQVDMIGTNDNVADPNQRHRPRMRYAIPVAAFAGGFMLAGVIIALERVLTLAT